MLLSFGVIREMRVSEVWQAILGIHRRTPAATAFAYGVLILLATSSLHGIDSFPYDSALYWDLGEPSDLKVDTFTARGYVFPVILYLVRHIADRAADPVFAYGVVASFAYALVLTVFVPRWFVGIFGGQLSVVRRLVPVLLIAVIFPGLILYPLSDLPALMFALCGLYCVFRAAAKVGPRGRSGFLLIAFAGACAVAAYNTRTIYIFAIPAVVLLVLVVFRTNRKVLLGAAMAGMMSVALPQAVLNKHAGVGFNPAVVFQVGENSLFVAQLLAGMTVQRYETAPPGGGLAYLDPAGIRVVESVRGRVPVYTFTEYLDGTADPKHTVTLGDYLGLVLEFPLEFVGIYTRHVVSGLDVRDGEVYVAGSTADRQFRSVMNFLVLAAAALTLATRRVRALSRSAEPPARYWQIGAIILLLPVAAIVPGAIETRFFLPLHLLAYCVLAFHASPREVICEVRARPHWLLFVVAVGALYFSIVLAGFAHG